MCWRTAASARSVRSNSASCAGEPLHPLEELEATPHLVLENRCIQYVPEVLQTSEAISTQTTSQLFSNHSTATSSLYTEIISNKESQPSRITRRRRGLVASHAPQASPRRHPRPAAALTRSPPSASNASKATPRHAATGAGHRAAVQLESCTRRSRAASRLTSASSERLRPAACASCAAREIEREHNLG